MKLGAKQLNKYLKTDRVIVVLIVGWVFASSMAGADSRVFPTVEVKLSVRKALGPDFKEPYPRSAFPNNDPFSEMSLNRVLNATNRIWSSCQIHFSLEDYGEIQLDQASEVAPSENSWKARRDELYRRIGKPTGQSPVDPFFDAFAKDEVLSENLARTFWKSDLSTLHMRDQNVEIPILVVPNASTVGYGGGFPSETILELSTLSLLEIYSFPSYLSQRTAVPFVQNGGRMILYGFNSSNDDFNSTQNPEIAQQQLVLAHEIGHYLGLSHEESWENLMYAGVPGPGGRGSKIEPHQCRYARNYLKTFLKDEDQKTEAGQPCKERIQKNLCSHSSGAADQCGQPSVANQKILDVYNILPDYMKKTMCSLSRIVVDDSITPGAVTQPIWSPALSLELHIRSDLLQKDFFSIEDYMSWRESMNYGASPDRLPQETTDASLPRFRFFPRQGANNYLVYLLAHELGHAFDLLHSEQTRWQTPAWVPRGFASTQPVPTLDFADRTRLCYFYCPALGVQSRPGGLSEIYAKEMSKEWISPYGSVSSMEEFAEVFAYYFMHNSMGIAFDRLSVPSENGPVQFDLEALQESSSRLRDLFSKMDALVSLE